MSKKIVIFAFFFFSMELFCAEVLSIAGKKRKLSAKSINATMSEETKKRNLLVFQDRDDDVEMELDDAPNIQESRGETICQRALQLKEKGIQPFLMDSCIRETKQADEYIAASKKRLKELCNNFNLSLFFENESDLENEDRIIAVSKLLQNGGQKQVGGELQTIALKIKVWQSQYDIPEKILELYS